VHSLLIVKFALGVGGLPLPKPIPPPSPELYDLIAEVVKGYWDECLARKLTES
jgi:hypothetical protein